MHTVIRFVTIAALVSAFVVPARGETIEQRKKRQERRIENGEKSGKLSPAEAERMQNKENAINKEEQDMKAANGGHLSPQERNLVKHQQRQTSHKIYEQKHDDNAK
jgi:hypothetical protein